MSSWFALLVLGLIALSSAADIHKIRAAVEEVERAEKAVLDAVGEEPGKREAVPSVHAASSVGCPDSDFIRFDFLPQYCYLFVQTPMSWYNANTYCRLRNAKLADIDNFNEHAVITTYTKNFANLMYMPGSSHPGYWIAVNDIFQEDNWVSGNTHKRVSFTVWQNNYPTKGKNQHDCVEMYKVWEYRWYNQVCTSLNGAICRVEYDYNVRP